jgi:hypothetical protein
MKSPKTITSRYTVGVQSATAYTRLCCDLSWTSALHVEVALIVHGVQSTRWVLSRDLIHASIAASEHGLGVGSGDVHLKRHWGDDRLMEIVLRSPSGTALLLMDRLDLIAFLSSTCSHVPLSADLDVSDEEIAQLCREVQP